MKKVILILFLVVPSLSKRTHADQSQEAGPFIEKARTLQLGKDPQWIKLLHFHHDIWNRWRSGVGDSSFFFSPEGERDPLAELNATLKSFFTSTATLDASPLCRYPARRDWLNEKLNFLSILPEVSCPRYDNWKAKLAPQSVQLVFASYYFNNPASMYGHTFLKLRRQGYEAGKGLLDYTVNYAAEANTNNGFAFAFKGLTGGYKGRFSTDPYYLKIQKYNNLESRDLWEYDLNLSSAEINRLIQHLWELGPVAMPYFFFNKNCSYELLPLLEAAKPDLEMSSKFRYRTIPLDTLQSVLHQSGLVSRWTLRPSHVRAMLARRTELSPDEADMAKTLSLKKSVTAESDLKKLSLERQSLVLDSAYDYLRYKAGFYRDRPQEAQEREQKLLLMRKDLPSGTTSLALNNVPPPQVAHPTGQAILFTGVTKHESFQEISVRGALNDQEADPTGYVTGSQLEMAHLRGRYYDQRRKFSLEQLTLVEVFSLAPWDPWVHPPSWRVWTGLETAHDLNKRPEDSLNYGVRGGSGFSFHLPYHRYAIWYAMWHGEFAVGGVFNDGYRMGLGGESGFVLPVGERLRFHLAADALRFPVGNVSNVVRYYTSATYIFSRDWEVRLIGERQNAYEEARLGLNYYW